VAVEAGASLGWHRWVGDQGEVLALDHFGASAPADRLFREFGFTVENIVATVKRVLGRAEG
jgi:transketolase